MEIFEEWFESNLRSGCQNRGQIKIWTRAAWNERQEEIDELKSILEELAPWASAALSDDTCCEELKAIFRKVVEKGTKGEIE